jgi:early endosome antigen 1
LSSENEVKKLQEKANELRRRLDDAQAGLLELGRENQSLQIFNNKAVTRKWADDSQVHNCMDCQKPFSVTNRKVCNRNEVFSKLMGSFVG